MLYEVVLSGVLFCVMPSCPVFCAVQCLFVRYIVPCNAFLFRLMCCIKRLSRIFCRMNRFCPVYWAVWRFFVQYFVLCRVSLPGTLCCVLRVLSGILCRAMHFCPLYFAVSSVFIRYLVLFSAVLPDILRCVHRFCPVYCAVYSFTDCRGGAPHSAYCRIRFRRPLASTN